MLEKLGEFQILELLGEGGMGSVYKGYQPSLDREVAIKVLAAHLNRNETYIARFQREARSAASLIHPNVIQIYTIGCENDIHYFAMEYVRGDDLSEHLGRGETFSIHRSAEIVLDVAQALGCASEVGLIHRDIKPSNIMLTERNMVKVTDFGLAKSMSSNLTEMGTIVGTANYMSPEQGQGKDLDIRTDIYSLGAVFFELLTGRVPFVADNPTAVLYKHVYEDAEAPSIHNPDVPPEVDRVVLRMLAKNPDDRFAGADDLEAELRSLLDSLDAASKAETRSTRAAVEPSDPKTKSSDVTVTRDEEAPQAVSAVVGRSALVADGIGSVRKLFGDVLHEMHFRVIEAEDGEQALEQAVSQRPSLILLDLNLEKVNGMELLEKLAGKKVESKVIVVSAFKNRETVLEAAKMQVHAFLAKPVNIHELRQRINQVMEEPDPAAPASAAEDTDGAAADVTRTRFMIVCDPSPYSRLLFRQILEAAGHQVACVDSLSAAAEMMREDTPDLLVFSMGADSGERERLVTLMEENGWDLPVVTVAASRDHEHLDAMRDREIGPVMAKPLEPDQFLGEVDAALAESKQRPKMRMHSMSFSNVVQQQRMKDQVFTVFDFARFLIPIIPEGGRKRYEERIRKESTRGVTGLILGALRHLAKEQDADAAMRYVKHAYRHGDFETRALCVALLREFLSEKHEAEVLTRIVTDEDHRIRIRVLHRMGEMRRPEFADIAVRFLNDDVWKVRHAAAECLEMLGGAAALDVLVAYYARTGETPQNRLRRMLLDCRGPEEIRRLEMIARKGEPGERRFVAELFGEIKSKQAVPVLVEMLEDRHPLVRAAAATSLGRLRNEKSLPKLIALLTDESAEVQTAVVQALFQFGLTPGAGALVQALANRRRRISDSAARLVAQLNRSPKELERALTSLAAQTEDARKYLSLLLGHVIPEKEHLTRVARDLASKDEPTRLRAVSTVNDAIRRKTTAG